jgi:hypothetical protein
MGRRGVSVRTVRSLTLVVTLLAPCRASADIVILLFENAMENIHGAANSAAGVALKITDEGQVPSV